MPQLLNARHERFCVLLVGGKNTAESYELAGFRPNNGNAYALRRKDHIAARVNELLAERQRQTAQATAKAVEELALTQEWGVEAECGEGCEDRAILPIEPWN
jgi:phage terminase small subunit